jgi:hypothetical protein
MTTHGETRRDWAGRTIAEGPIAYINRTGQNVDAFDRAILDAIANGGTFGEDFADVFVLTRPAGVWILDFA